MVGRVMSSIFPLIAFGGIPLYISARLILIVLPLTGLRALPPSAFADVKRNMYLPHI
jgi:hypothetical protein